MAGSRLTLAHDAGLLEFPAVGRIAVFSPRADTDLSALPKERLGIIQGFYPDHMAFKSLGFKTATDAAGDYSSALVFLPRAKREARALIANALAVAGGGPVVIDGQKTDGIDSILKDCRAHGGEIASVFAKAHGKLFTLSGGDFADWVARGPTEIAGGFVTDDGVFSADGIDRGSAVLAAALPDKLSGKVADLGAGWGYLAHQMLQRPGVAECHLIEAEHTALICARRNISDPRARFHWADVVNFADEGKFDHIVTNPPFHTSRAADPNLGRAFITASAQLLSRHGVVWLVANRHLPYEQHLSATFKEVEEVSGDALFKVFRAARARPRTS